MAATRRYAAIAAIVLGLGLIVVTPALSLFSGAPAGERILNRFTPVLSRGGIAQLRHDFANVEAMSNQFFGTTVPDLRRQLGMTPRQFDTYVAIHYPAVATAARDIPPAVKFVAPTIPLISGSHDDFETAKTLPAFGLPPRSAPWALVGIGAALALLGGVALWRPSRLTTAALAAAGVALIAVPLALSIPHKANAGTHLGDVGRITLSDEAHTTALRTMRESDALVTEVDTSLIPALAARAHVTPAAETAAIAHSYPAVARVLADWPGLRHRGFALVQIMGESTRDYKRVDAVPVGVLPWLLIGPGIVLTLLGGLALRGEVRSRVRSGEPEFAR
jgi:hypothetical protein